MVKMWRGSAVVVLMAMVSSAWVMTVDATPQEQPAPQAVAYAGGDLFRTYCATCHGAGAKGDGPLAEMLKKRPADLTLFAKNNNGTYPAELVGRIIDGRDPVAGHGGKDMPVWGDAFKQSEGGLSEDAIKARIEALVRHLATLQVK